MKTLTRVCAVALAGACCSAYAQTQAPGLWEHSMTFKTQSGEMEKQMAQMQKELAAMPPDQRKMMEQMMASRGVGMGPKGNTFKVCVSKEEAARREGPKMGENCTQEVLKRTSNSMRMKWQCTGQHPSSGEGEVTFTSDKAYTGSAVMTTTMKGKPETMNVEQSGQWLSADCGSMAPKDAVAPKETTAPKGTTTPKALTTKP